MKVHAKILGIWFSNASGNCFAPAIQIDGDCLTIRTSHGLETRFWYWNGKFGWNSDHIAVRFGEYIEGDPFMGYPDTYNYKGILGTHQYV